VVYYGSFLSALWYLLNHRKLKNVDTKRVIYYCNPYFFLFSNGTNTYLHCGKIIDVDSPYRKTLLKRPLDNLLRNVY